MTPCACNTEMGDTCTACAPQPVAPAPKPASDREGWPVLVRTTEGDYEWPASHGELAVWNEDDVWYASARGTSVSTMRYSKEAAAEALHARLPDEASTPAPVDPRDAEIATIRGEVEAFRRAACVATGWGEHTTPGDARLIELLRADAREITTLRTTVSKAHDALDLAGVSRGGTVEDRIARLALTQKPSDATRWAVVKAVVEEMGDEAVDIDATVPASVVRVALAALRAVVS